MQGHLRTNVSVHRGTWRNKGLVTTMYLDVTSPKLSRLGREDPCSPYPLAVFGRKTGADIARSGNYEDVLGLCGAWGL